MPEATTTAPARTVDRERRVATGGPLVVIGGAEDRDGTCAILSELVRLAGGEDARVVVLAVAAREPRRVGAAYVELFERLGVAAARTLEIGSREAANDGASVAALADATAVFFTGGDQVRITRLLGGTALDRALHERHARGMVLGGTSAGAAMMSGVMIVGGMPRSAFRGGVELGPGLDFVSGVLIDQHFEERGRLRRLLWAVSRYPHDVGLGIDEDTAAIIANRRMEVVGRGVVTVIDAARLSFIEPTAGDPGALAALCGVQVHFLPAGFGFDFVERKPFCNHNLP
jgi:cyanophycinase